MTTSAPRANSDDDALPAGSEEADGDASPELDAVLQPPKPIDFSESLQILVRYQRGDRDAGDELVRRYEDKLRRYVRVLLGARLRERVESVDIVQDAFVDALPRLADFEYRQKGCILAYLKSVARSRVRNLARSPRLPRIDNDPTKDAFWLDQLPGNEGSVSMDLSRRELNAILDEAASRLPERQQEVFGLRYYFNAPWDQVVAEMKYPSRAAAEMAYDRAKKQWVAYANPRLKSWVGDGR